MRYSSSTSPLASKGSKGHSFHGRGKDDQNQGKRQTRGPPPPPYYRSTVDCAPAPPPYDYQASMMDLGISRKTLNRQIRRGERDEDLQIVIDDYDDSDSEWALRCNFRHMSSERKNEADAAYTITEEEEESEDDSQSKDDCLWAAKMLHAQEQLEKRLGSGYY